LCRGTEHKREHSGANAYASPLRVHDSPHHKQLLELPNYTPAPNPVLS
jgi:hypothetical protein